MAKLVRSASGYRHLRWLREIVATMEAHLQHNDGLTESQNELLSREIPRLRARIEALGGAVKPYREFLEGEHVRLRAKQRVARYLIEEAERETDGKLRNHGDKVEAAIPGGLATLFSAPKISRALSAGNKRTAALAQGAATMLRSLRAQLPVANELANRLDRAGALLSQFSEELATVEEPRRRPLKAAVERAINDARESLSQMEFNLRAQFPSAFIDSLYPELTRGNTLVADEDDEDDDATAPPDARL
jgi:cob(I)alamin adenosyltransferase